uniref:7TM_GPCR_Srx domain-containing protein n=1 Tax=Globodera pallida TaxID=36090 RepID=A0A183C2Z8_GLOPA
MNFSALPSSATASPSPVATIFMRVFGSLSYALLSAMSIAMNCLLIAVLSYGHYQFRRMAFFTLAWQMIVCDLMAQSIQMIVAVPITFAGKAVYGHSFLYYALLFLDTVAYNVTLHFSALLTINRLGVFFLPRINELLFSYPNIFKTIAFLWLYVFVFCSCYIMIGCRKSFSETGFFMYHDCPEQLSPAGILFRQSLVFCL